MPLALSWPKILEGFGSLIRFHTTDATDGWRKLVISPGAILKLRQSSTAPFEARMFSCEPTVVAAAEPAVALSPSGFAFAKFVQSGDVRLIEKTRPRRADALKRRRRAGDFLAARIFNR